MGRLEEIEHNYGHPNSEPSWDDVWWLIDELAYLRIQVTEFKRELSCGWQDAYDLGWADAESYRIKEPSSENLDEDTSETEPALPPPSEAT